MICNGPRVYECALAYNLNYTTIPITNFVQKWFPLNVEELKSLSTQIPNISILHRICMYQRISQVQTIVAQCFYDFSIVQSTTEVCRTWLCRILFGTSPFTRSSFEKKWTRPSKRFLFAGSLIESKGLDLLLKAFELYEP